MLEQIQAAGVLPPRARFTDALELAVRRQQGQDDVTARGFITPQDDARAGTVTVHMAFYMLSPMDTVTLET